MREGSWDKCYLLSLEECAYKAPDQSDRELQQNGLWKSALLKLDRERLHKVEQLKNNKKQMESMGAGLLLQLAVQEALADMEHSKTDEIVQLSFVQLLEKLRNPLPLEYTYGDCGKPYLKNYPFYFNISHSGNYVFCVISNQEVGADIQLKQQQVNERLLQRFFATEEKAYWEQCNTDAEKRDFFYRMWCRKEAYGKLTGKGIGEAVSVNMCLEQPSICIKEYNLSEDYQIAVCKWK